MAFLGLSKTDEERLQFEVISDRARLKLTRLIRGITNAKDMDIQLIRQNRFVNMANNVLGKPLYVLESDDWGHYQPAEHAWHIGEIELIMRRPTTVDLVEILADMIEHDLLDHTDVNNILQDDGSSVFFEKAGFEEDVRVYVSSIEEIEDIQDTDEHPNIRKLIDRLEYSLSEGDYSAVLHTSASVFETLAKDVVNLASIQNKSLGGFFDKYRKESNLPEPILDYILEIFRKRNTEPLAGHGSTQEPTIDEGEAILLVEITKTFVRLERQLAMPQIQHGT